MDVLEPNQNKQPLVYLHKLTDIEAALHNIEDDLEGVSFEEFIENKKLRQSIMYELHIVSTSSRFLLHILSEADKQQSSWLRKAFAPIPFKALVVLREMFFHEGENCRASDEENYRLVWNMCKNDLPAIKNNICKIRPVVAEKYTLLRRKN